MPLHIIQSSCVWKANAVSLCSTETRGILQSCTEMHLLPGHTDYWHAREYVGRKSIIIVIDNYLVINNYLIVINNYLVSTGRFENHSEEGLSTDLNFEVSY